MTEKQVSDLADLEDSYQIHRVLDDSEPVSAVVRDVGVVDERIHVHIELGESSYSLRFRDQTDGYLDFRQLCIFTGTEFQSNLSGLISESVDLNIEYDEYGQMRVYLGGEKAAVTGPDTDISIATSYPSQLSEEVVKATRRLARHREDANDYVSAVIEETTAEGGKLVLGFDIYGERIEWEIPVEEDLAEIDGSEYQSVIEKIGGGAVKGIEGTEIYLVLMAELGSKPEHYVDLIGTVEDGLSKWGIFPNQEAAKLCRLEDSEKKRRLQRRHTAKKWGDSVSYDFDDNSTPSSLPREITNNDSFVVKVGEFAVLAHGGFWLLAVLLVIAGAEGAAQIAFYGILVSFGVFILATLIDSDAAESWRLTNLR